MNPPSARVNRYDVATFGRPERTPQGFLRVPAAVTRAGVFAYKRADGTTIREYRPAAEVFAPRSLASLAAAPVTDLHPTEMITPANVRKLSVGHVGEGVRQDGMLVAAPITIEDGEVIAKVERGDRREVSMGYQCRIDATPGAFNGEAYDVVQRDIVYNHAALGPRNWGRAGRDIALRIDSGGAADGDEDVFRLDAAGALSELTFDAPSERHNDDGGDEPMDQVTLRIDQLDITVPKPSAQVVEKAISTRDASITQLTAARDALQGKLDSVTAELATTKTVLAEAQDPKRLDAIVNERAALVEQAKRVLPAEHKFDGLTTRQIHEAVLLHLDSKLDLKTRSAEYVSARFDHAISTLPADDKQSSTRSDALDQARRASGNNPPPPAPPPTRQDSAAHLPPWQQPLAVSRDAR